MVAVVLALLASGLWGAADFLGGSLSRRLPTGLVLVTSQGAGLVVVTAAVLATGTLRAGPHMAWGAGAGLVGTLALGLFYRALALGTMSVVAPIAGIGLVVPVAVGLAAGERPSAVQLAGIVLAATGVALASTPEVRGAGGSRRSVGYAVMAALGFGAVLVLVDQGSETSVATTLLAMRVAAVASVAVFLAVTRAAFTVAVRDLPRAALIGGFDLGAIGAYGLASRGELVSVVAVLASLYPVVTALLARRVYGERLSGSQLAGVAGALAGVVLLAGG